MQNACVNDEECKEMEDNFSNAMFYIFFVFLYNLSNNGAKIHEYECKGKETLIVGNGVDDTHLRACWVYEKVDSLCERYPHAREKVPVGVVTPACWQKRKN